MKKIYNRILITIVWSTVLYQTTAFSADLPELLILHRDSIGTIESIEAVKSMTLDQHLSIMVLEGTTRTVTATPDKYWTHIETAVMTMTEASNGTSRWKRDQNGQVTIQEDTSVLPVSAQVLPEFQYLFPNDAIVATDQGLREVDGVQYRLLEINAPGYKKPRLKYIEQATGRCIREDLEQDGIVMTNIYSDFMTVDGITMPGKTVQQMSIPGLPATTLTVTAMRLNEPVDMALFEPPPDDPVDYTFPDIGQVTVPMAINGEHLIVDVGIDGGSPVRFLLDSGAASTIIDCAYADELGLKRIGGMHAVGVGGAESVDKIEIDRLSIGEFSIDALHLFCMDLGKIAEMLGMSGTLKGIIGYDLFARTVMKLDYTGGQLSIFDPARFVYEGSGKAVPGELINNLLCVNGVIDGDISGKLRIDTGAAGGLHLHAGYLRSQGLLDRFQKGSEVEVHGAGGKMSLHTVDIASVALGEYEVFRPEATLTSGPEQSILDTMDAMATVGNRVLSQFVVFFDFGNSRLILEPTEKPAPIGLDQMNKAGMSVSDDPEGFVIVRQIMEDSPAAKAGLLKNDRIVQIGKLKPGKGLTAATVDGIMHAENGVSHRIKVIRNGETRRFRIKLV